MKTLDEHNKERYAAHDAQIDAMKPHANGIACPKCQQELWDSNPSITLTSNPALKTIHCPACGYQGYRVV